MPIRPRRVRRSRWALTPRLDLALSLGPAPGGDADLDDDLLRATYVEHRDRLLDRERPGARPWAFWRFEESVPDALRATRPALREVHEDVRRERAECDAEAADEIDLDLRRSAWLRVHGSASPSANGAGKTE